MFLSDTDIRSEMAKHEIIRNADLDECLGPASYQLRIRTVRQAPGAPEIEVPDGYDFFIAANAMVLVGVHEEVSLPRDLCGFLKLKSSLGRLGYVSWDQGFVEPGYQGSLTIVLHNFSHTPTLMRGGQKICHLILGRTEQKSSKGYASEYQGSKGATLSKAPQALIFGSFAGELVSEGARAAAHAFGEEIVKTIVHGSGS